MPSRVGCPGRAELLRDRLVGDVRRVVSCGYPAVVAVVADDDGAVTVGKSDFLSLVSDGVPDGSEPGGRVHDLVAELDRDFAAEGAHLGESGGELDDIGGDGMPFGVVAVE